MAQAKATVRTESESSARGAPAAGTGRAAQAAARPGAKRRRATLKGEAWEVVLFGWKCEN
ncbi:hypothetical protein GCM10010286_41120 [Streptomyces toxytricini]|nr:hypothetical protein GCM10010286_41120 [Streptomyces toxytricini]